MLISHWSSDVCSSDLGRSILCRFAGDGARTARYERAGRKASEVRGATFSPLKGRGLVVAALALLFVAPAHADTLIDNVNGITLDKDCRLVRFPGLVIDTDGKVKALLDRKDKRPERPDLKQDARGNDRKSTR